jgi:predicted ATP-binding protein involved in virulence
VDLKDDGGPEVATLFSEARDIIHAETWLLILDGDASRNEEMRKVYDSVIAAVRTLLDLEDLTIEDRRVWVTERGGQRVLFEALSDGYLTTAGWFLDLIARWIELLTRNGEAVPPDFLATARGLVLIDELDLHLHPRWQIEAIGRIRRLLPQMSFIVTTHNPLTLVGACPEEIWVLSADGGKVEARSGVEAPMLLTGGQIFRQYFDIKDIYPDALGRKLQRYGFLSGYAERDDAEEQEMIALAAELSAAGLLPEWEVVPRARSRKDRATTTGRSPRKRIVKGST